MFPLKIKAAFFKEWNGLPKGFDEWIDSCLAEGSKEGISTGEFIIGDEFMSNFSAGGFSIMGEDPVE
jgi:hypothetical protein